MSTINERYELKWIEDIIVCVLQNFVCKNRNRRIEIVLYDGFID